MAGIIFGSLSSECVNSFYYLNSLELKMRNSQSQKIQEQEETSPFEAAHVAMRASKNYINSKQYLIPVLIGIVIFSIILIFWRQIEQQNRQLQQKIVELSKEQNELSVAISGEKAGGKDSSSGGGNLDGSQNEINYDLFQESKAKVTKNDKNTVTHIFESQSQKQFKGQTKGVKKENLMMQVYLQGVNKTLANKDNVPKLIEGLLQAGSQNQFPIPKLLWIYSNPSQSSKQSIYVNACIENTKRIASLHQFQVKIVNEDNLKEFVPKERAEKVDEVIKDLKKQATHNPISGYESVLEPIIQNLVLLEILHERGGIVMDRKVILTENFTWLFKLHQNQYVSCGNCNYPTKYFGFHNINFTSSEEKYSLPDGSWKYISNHVGLQSFFLAGLPKGEFMEQTLKMMYIILSNPQSARQTLAALKIGRAITNVFILLNSFPIACRLVLKQKEQLAERGLLAIDYFGIKSINSLFFPNKISHYFQYSFELKIYKHIAYQTLQQFQETVGPLRYMVILPFQSFIEDLLKKTFKNTLSAEMTEVLLLHPDSFAVRFLFPKTEKAFLMINTEKKESSGFNKTWTALPKIIWTQIPPSGKRNFIEWITYQNLVRHAAASGFEVRSVNLVKLQEWLNQYEIDWITNTGKKAKTKIYNKMKVEIAKLHILIRYGGIWISKHYFALESFDWILNITSYPSNFVYNRYGDLPKVVMYFHPHYGQPFDWTFDAEANTKNIWHCALDSNFIAAEPESQLLKDWVRTFTKFLTRPYNENLGEMIRLNVQNERWTVKQNAYFSMLDAIKMTIANKQKEIIKAKENETYIGQKSAPQFYKVWSISGSQGPLKLDVSFASLTNEKGQLNPKSNTLIWRYPKSYTQGIVGKVHKFGKLYHINSAELLRLVSRTELSNLTALQIDTHSFFYEDLYHPVESRVSRQRADLVFE